MAAICLVSLNAAGAFHNGKAGHIGGAERQAALMARWFVRQGHQVSVIVWADHVGQQAIQIDGLRLIPTCERGSGLPILRLVWPGWTSLNRALSEADADVYVHNLPESTAGKVALWTKRHNRRFVCMIASELECTRGLAVFDAWQEKLLFAAGLQRADLIIAQTQRQKNLLRKHWDLDATVAPMPCDPPATADRNSHVGQSGPVLWIGRIDPIKRVELLLEVATRLPTYSFDLIGEFASESGYANSLRRRADAVENLNLLGRRPFDEVWAHYQASSLLVCTSAHEGFPNTFLEAMYFGLPVVSTFDPDDIIERFGLGAAVTSSEEMIEAITELKTDASAYAAASRRCRDYFQEFHAAPKALAKIEGYICAASVD